MVRCRTRGVAGRRAATAAGAGGCGQAGGSPAAPAAQQPAYLVHPSLVANLPLGGDWALCLPGNTRKLDLLFFGVRRGLHTTMFRKMCADAGVPGLAGGTVKKGRSTVRVKLVNIEMIKLIGKYGISLFSRELRRLHGWRCAALLPAGPQQQQGGETPFPLTHNSFAALATGEAVGSYPTTGTGAQVTVPAPAGVGGVLAAQPNTRGLRLGSWNANRGIASTEGGLHEPLKVVEMRRLLFARHHDIVAVQETGTGDATAVRGDGNFSWHPDPRPGAGQGRGLGFFIRHSLTVGGQITVGLPDATCLSCLWLRVRGAGSVPDLYIGCVYLPSTNHSVTSFSDALAKLQADTILYSGCGEVVLLGDFNARVGRAREEYERVGRFGEEHSNSRGQQLISLLDATDLYIMNGRRQSVEVEWTRVRHLQQGAGAGTTQRSVLDYALASANVLATSWKGESLQVLPYDTPGLDHNLLEMDLNTWGRARRRARRARQQTTYWWRLDRLLAGPPEERAAVREAYSEALASAAPEFEDFTRQLLEGDASDDEVADRAAARWLEIVREKALQAVGRRKITPGRTKSWWDAEMERAIALRRAVFKQWRDGQYQDADLGEEYQQRRASSKLLARIKRKQQQERELEGLSDLWHSSPHAFWRRMNAVVGGRRAAAARLHVTAVQDPHSGGLATDDAGIARVFRDHYATLACPGPEEQPPASSRQRVEGVVRQAAEEVAASRLPRCGGAAATAGGECGMAAVGSSSGSVVEGSSGTAAPGGGNASGAAPAGGGGQQGDSLGRPFSAEEVAAVQRRLPNGKAAHDDEVPNELIKYGGEGMVSLAGTLFNTMLRCETAPAAWRRGTIVSPHKAGDKTDPGNYRGITLLATVGKAFCRCINNRLAEAVPLHEGQAGFSKGRGCEDNVFTLYETIRQRREAGQRTYVFYLDIRKAFDSTWHDGMWSKLWEKGVRGPLWSTIRNMYGKMRSRARVNGVLSADFPVRRGTAQGCTLSPLLYNIYADGLLQAVEAAGLGVAVGPGSLLGGLMFADDFAGLEASPERLQQLINVVGSYLEEWGLKANVAKSAIVVYGPQRTTTPQPEGGWRWHDSVILVQDTYKYLGLFLHGGGSWTSHVASVITKGNAALAKYGQYLRAKQLDRSVRLLVYKQYVRPVLEYGAEVWRPNVTQGKELEGIQMQAARTILGCFQGTASSAIRAELGLEPLSDRRLRAQLRWFGKLRRMEPHRLPARVHAMSSGARSWQAELEGQWQTLGGASGQADLQLHTLFPAGGGPSCFVRAGRILREASQQRLRQNMSQRTTLVHLPDIPLYPLSLQPYLRGPATGAGTHLKMQCRTGSLPVNRLLFVRHVAPNPFCPCCLPQSQKDETVEHFLLHCPAYDECRAKLHDALTPLLLPPAAPFDIYSADNTSCTAATLLGDKFWIDNGCFNQANKAICVFLEESWKVRVNRLPADL
jgi:hypothetical protein